MTPAYRPAPAVAVIATLAIAVGILWWILASIEPATYFAMTDELESVSVWLLWIAAGGQTAFVGLWLSLPWYREWVGRALMVKSVALATYLDFALVIHYLDPFPALPLLAVILFGFITVGILSQLATIATVMVSAWRRRASAVELPD